MNAEKIAARLDAVHGKAPLVHCITNCVTVNDCANALLAVGASPIMSDEPDDVEDITSICDGLDLNIGTLNHRSIEAMGRAAARAAELGHAIVLDPVGAGASGLRTDTARTLLERFHPALVRGNMSEIKALAGASAKTRGVDVATADAVSDENLEASAALVRKLSQKWGSVVLVTGAIDIASDGHRTVAIRNGVAPMGRITGTGCMLSALLPAFLAAGDDALLSGVAATCLMGTAGETARARLSGQDGTGSFRTYLIDALSTIDGASLAKTCRIEEL
ncbi:MAG: hydroxyethylthiazole kinase [Olsenella sp.]|jgi:hydroxyethylthiazole kinase|nr:hydroxyethylthiazole kinase [Olsenella sp.]